MVAVLFLHEGDNAQVVALPCRIQFQVGFASERRSRTGVSGAGLVQPAHYRGVVQLVTGIFTAGDGGMQRRFCDGQPNLRSVALLSALELSNLEPYALMVVLL